MQEAACEDAVAAYVDVAGFLFNVVKEDIICKKISAARRRWNVRSKVLSDELDEDEDLHNKLKCDQDTSGEQIAADNVKISTLETIGEKCKCGTTHSRDWYVGEGLACQVRDFRVFQCDRDLRETVGGISRGQQNNN